MVKKKKKICLQCSRPRFDPWVGKIPWRRKWRPTPISLPGEFHGQKNLAGCSPWGYTELDMTKGLTLSFFHLIGVCTEYLRYTSAGNSRVFKNMEWSLTAILEVRGRQVNSYKSHVASTFPRIFSPNRVPDVNKFCVTLLAWLFYLLIQFMVSALLLL